MVENSLKIEKSRCIFRDAIFFDLEHYIYKKPICIGVFGCCFYDHENEVLKVTQYMIENKKDAKLILQLAKEYFENMIRENKKYIVTFSGNNDFTVINYLFEKYNMEFNNIEDYFISVDLQKQYEKEIHKSIGLKALEKEFGITREDKVISGSNLAKTFSKIIKDSEYINRMPQVKKEKILLYNEQDIVSLFNIYTKWNNVFIGNK
nr:ribonuclease H-like domain-containing protein [Clostridium kluyveri]